MGGGEYELVGVGCDIMQEGCSLARVGAAGGGGGVPLAVTVTSLTVFEVVLELLEEGYHVLGIRRIGPLTRSRTGVCLVIGGSATTCASPGAATLSGVCAAAVTDGC